MIDMIDMIGMMFIGAKGHAVKRILLMLLMSAVCVVHASCHYFIFPNFKARAKISLFSPFSPQTLSFKRFKFLRRRLRSLNESR